MDELLDRYAEMFGDGFPTFPFLSMSDDEIEKIIKHCIDSGKDAYELGYVSDDPDIKY